MRAILRFHVAPTGQIMTGLLLLALLAPPFGLVSASTTSRTAVAALTAEAPRSPLDAIRGKGGWFLIFGGDWMEPDADRAHALVDSAVWADLSHLYIRIADSRRHFYGGPALQDLLPIAHSRGLTVIGWIEPVLSDPISDAADAIAAARFQRKGQRLDGLTLTIEGIRHDPNVGQYLSGIRSGVLGTPGLGDQYLLIASTLPTPLDHPRDAYASMSRYCQVFAPLAYWRATGRPRFVGPAGVRSYLDQIFRQFKAPAVNPFNRPLTITAQAYNSAPENGTPGSPPAEEIVASMDETRVQGGVSWSFYRFADADNGVVADEAQAITAYPFWQRSQVSGATIGASGRPASSG